MRIAVCVATFRRPAMLDGLLASLARVATPPEAEPVLILVDNDAAESARPMADAWRGRLRWPLLYAVEVRPGISHARNRAVALALERGADLVAFLDDDEVAAPSWLESLLHARRTFSADVVQGPVLPRFTGPAPGWVLRGRFFHERRRPTGTLTPAAKCGNVLIDRRVFTGLAAPFDPALATTGGEDTHFFLRARRAGARIVWADDAVVEEAVPPERATARWILRRAFRAGNGFYLCECALGSPRRRRVLRAAIAAARVARGGLVFTLSFWLGRAWTVRALCQIWQGAGTLAAAAGYRFHAYRRTDEY